MKLRHRFFKELGTDVKLVPVIGCNDALFAYLELSEGETIPDSVRIFCSDSMNNLGVFSFEIKIFRSVMAGNTDILIVDNDGLTASYVPEYGKAESADMFHPVTEFLYNDYKKHKELTQTTVGK